MLGCLVCALVKTPHDMYVIRQKTVLQCQVGLIRQYLTLLLRRTRRVVMKLLPASQPNWLPHNLCRQLYLESMQRLWKRNDRFQMWWSDLDIEGGGDFWQGIILGVNVRPPDAPFHRSPWQMYCVQWDDSIDDGEDDWQYVHPWEIQSPPPPSPPPPVAKALKQPAVARSMYAGVCVWLMRDG